MWESQVTGCQLLAAELLKAHSTPGQVNPAWTCGFSVTYTWSS